MRLFEGDVRDRVRDADAYDAILLDVDNGPSSLVHDSNAGLYTRAGVRAAFEALRAPGVLMVWSLTEASPTCSACAKQGSWLPSTSCLPAPAAARNTSSWRV